MLSKVMTIFRELASIALMDGPQFAADVEKLLADVEQAIADFRKVHGG